MRRRLSGLRLHASQQTFFPGPLRARTRYLGHLIQLTAKHECSVKFRSKPCEPKSVRQIKRTRIPQMKQITSSFFRTPKTNVHKKWP